FFPPSTLATTPTSTPATPSTSKPPPIFVSKLRDTIQEIGSSEAEEDDDVESGLKDEGAFD
ncbi:unnamed protein product, partial [Ilex paraguariensis]